MKHENKRICLECNRILRSADNELIRFAAYIRAAYPEAHVSCAFRGENEQNEAFERGFSRARWPDSKHNKTPAKAIDFFYQDKFGKGIWDAKWFKMVLDEASRMFGLMWGGRWNRPDFPHVEMKE